MQENQIKEYIVVQAFSADLLMQSVNQEIQAGYQPYGSMVSFAPFANNYPFFFQPMVKY